jgi:hypothetical protein
VSRISSFAEAEKRNASFCERMDTRRFLFFPQRIQMSLDDSRVGMVITQNLLKGLQRAFKVGARSRQVTQILEH